MQKKTNHNDYLKFAIYLYFLLILFDGILRKWVLPSLSSLIMTLKIAVSIGICLIGYQYYKKMTTWENSFFIIGIIAFLTTLTFGHGNIAVAIYGCIPYFFGLATCFIIGRHLSSLDLHTFNKIIIYTSLLNSLLVIIQFFLSPSHFLNFQGGAVKENIAHINISDLAGGFRPAGIFIYNNQNSSFSLLAFSLILYYLFFTRNIINKKILTTACILEITASPCAVSRTNIILHIGIIIYFMLLCLNQKSLKKVFKYTLLSIPFIILIAFSSFGEKALNNIGKRFESASKSQTKVQSTTVGTIIDIYNRNIRYNIEALIDPHPIGGGDVPFSGFGQGMSTQVGGKLMGLKKNAGFALAEWDGLRIMCESGLLLGWIIIFIRLGYTIRFIPSIIKYKHKKMFLPILIYPSFFISFYLITTWGNAFLLNFAILTAGMFLASVRINKTHLHINRIKRISQYQHKHVKTPQ